MMKKIVTIFLALSLFACQKVNDQAVGTAVQKYVCSMHPQIVQEEPGTCPICAMALVPLIHKGDGSSISLNESQLRLANISTTMVVPEEISHTTLLTGRLVVDEDQTEVISSRAGGRVETLAIKEEGQRISKGQLLYEIYSEPLLTLEEEYLVTLQQAEQLGSREQRYLSFRDAAEKKLLLYGLTQAQIAELGRTRRIDSRIRFFSPVSGYVSGIEVTEGQYISEGSSLYRIEQLDKIWVEAELYPQEKFLVKEGNVVEVEVAGFENTRVKGRVTFMSPEYRSGSQVIIVRAEISNPNGVYLPGMQANIVLIHSTRISLALPLDAVVRSEEGSHIWILTPEGTFASRMVETGIENDEKIEITSGLKARENVVISGAYLLYSELLLKRGGNLMEPHNQ